MYYNYFSLYYSTTKKNENPNFAPPPPSPPLLEKSPLYSKMLVLAHCGLILANSAY